TPISHGPIQRDVIPLASNRFEYRPRVIVSRLSIIRFENDTASQLPPVPVAESKSTIFDSLLCGLGSRGRDFISSGFLSIYTKCVSFCGAINGPHSILACFVRSPFSIRLRSAIAHVIAACQCSYGSAFGPIRREVVDRGEPSVGMYC